MNIPYQKQINYYLGYYFNTIVIVIVLGILIGSYFFILLPKKQSADERVGSEAAVREQRYLSLKSELSRLEELTIVYDSIDSKNIAKLDKILPKKIELEELIKQMEVIMMQNGLFLSNITTREAKNLTPDIGSAEININVVGADYLGFKNLLRSLENNLRLMDIQSLTFAPGGKGSSLIILAYYQK
ncbi:hypothetical protein ISS03_00115 [Patescibacteria group bacterium]|nr:hypothetical protein [Patescibacteria group bacterium]